MGTNWLHASLQDKPKDWVVLQLYARIDDDKRRGGDYAVLARFNEKIVKEHHMTRDGRQACAACRDPWPCATVASVLAPG
ncbi:hypothetical protein M8C11_18660 [Micromonospora sp. CPM1]|uniref:hypothetical protein n=1 Tax=Micromonospora sp. CPM1 TaxID=2944809 RepID=UPI00207D52A9|nr:hypothetical protein [Micromonospora sp. CPM1]MCO1616738.1 hypothetical protein [Micromonospora sp. CPM1]